MTTATAPRPARRPPRPATEPVAVGVRVRLALTTEAGVESDFTLARLTPDPRVARWAVRLAKPGGADVYDIHMDLYGVVHCDCGDGTFHPERPGGCKHVAALRKVAAVFAGLPGLATAPTGTAPPAAA